MSAHVAETAQLLFLLCGPFPMPAGFTTLFCVCEALYRKKKGLSKKINADTWSRFSKLCKRLFHS